MWFSLLDLISLIPDFVFIEKKDKKSHVHPLVAILQKFPCFRTSCEVVLNFRYL